MKKILFLLLALFSFLEVSPAQTPGVIMRGYNWQKSKLLGPNNGILFYDLDLNTLTMLKDSTWISPSTGATASGDLTGTFPSPTIATITNFIIGVDSLRTVNFTVPQTKSVFPVSTATAKVTATLPDATLATGRTYTFLVRTGTNKLFVAPAGSQTINGGGSDSSLTGTANKSITLIATDSTWHTIASH